MNPARGDLLDDHRFSAIIHYWALAVAVPTERIEELIGDVVLPEEGDVASEPLTRET